jgi:hypothetical protein
MRILSYTAVKISELACLTLLQQRATTMCELILIVRGGKNYSEFHEQQSWKKFCEWEERAKATSKL